jgi:outer membrane protein TolC
MDDPAIPVTSPTLILPATVPLEEPVKMNLQDLIGTAMENRFELGQQILRMDSTGVANSVAKNNLLPQLNLVGSVGLQGFSSNWTNAAGNQFSSDDSFPSWSIGLQFELPIGNRAARAVWKRTLLQREQAIAQYQQIVDQVSLDVKTAWRDVETKWEQMEAARSARFAAADALKAVEQREEGGEALTYTFVQLKLDTQQRYADAQAAEVQAISDYNRALMKLEFAKGTLLRYNNVVMEEAPIQRY